MGKTTDTITDDFLREHATLIRDFLLCLFRPDEQVHICALVDEVRYGHLLHNPREMPVLTNGRDPRRTMSFSRKASSLNTRALRDLHLLNRAGWDIFFCVNPLTCGRRCQRTVRIVRHILLESDSAPLAKQRDILHNVFGTRLSAIQWTGGRSIHGYLRLTKVIWNPHRVGWDMARLLKGDTSCRIPEYTPLANHWIRTMERWGLPLDAPVIRDFARLSRMPGFIHSDTGNVSKVEKLNPSCKGWMMASGSDNADEGYQPSMEEWEDGLAVMEGDLKASLLEEHMDDHGGSIRSHTIPRESSSPSIVPDSPVSPHHPLGMNIVCESDPSSPPKASFLDDMEVFGRIKTMGIPARHRRRELHKALFTAARVFGWDEGRMASEWRGIILIAPGNIGETPEDAVSDMLGHWEAVRTGTGRVYLPDLGRLPGMTPSREGNIRLSVAGMGCPSPRNAARILARVVWPKVGRAGGQCLGGTLNLRAVEMRDACPDRRYREALEWMMGAGLLECTGMNYLPGRRTRTYRVNVPMLIWLAGFRTGDLAWGRARAGAT